MWIKSNQNRDIKNQNQELKHTYTHYALWSSYVLYYFNHLKVLFWRISK